MLTWCLFIWLFDRYFPETRTKVKGKVIPNINQIIEAYQENCILQQSTDASYLALFLLTRDHAMTIFLYIFPLLILPSLQSKACV